MPTKSLEIILLITLALVIIGFLSDMVVKSLTENPLYALFALAYLAGMLTATISNK